MQDTSIQASQFSLELAIAEWLAQKETIGSKRTRAEYEETIRRFRALRDVAARRTLLDRLPALRWEIAEALPR